MELSFSVMCLPQAATKLPGYTDPVHTDTSFLFTRPL
jgi:hypothetical protein